MEILSKQGWEVVHLRLKFLSPGSWYIVNFVSWKSMSDCRASWCPFFSKFLLLLEKKVTNSRSRKTLLQWGPIYIGTFIIRKIKLDLKKGPRHALNSDMHFQTKTNKDVARALTERESVVPCSKKCKLRKSKKDFWFLKTKPVLQVANRGSY